MSLFLKGAEMVVVGIKTKQNLIIFAAGNMVVSLFKLVVCRPIIGPVYCELTYLSFGFGVRD